MDLQVLTNDIKLLDTDLSHDEVLSVYNRVLAARAAIAALKKRMDEALIDWIKVNGPLFIGDQMVYAGKDKRTKCVDIPGCLEAILTEVGGDFTAFCSLLASQPIKYGAAKQVLGDQWSRYFVVEEGDKVKVKETRADG
jgi:hypothetical protein